MMHINTAFMVEAENDLGRATSDYVQYDVMNIVKPDPPDIVSVSAVLQGVLRIEWKNSMPNLQIKDLKYNLRYRTKDSSEWSEVPGNDLENTRDSFTLQELQPYTTYVISIRCHLINRGFWSEWSKEHTAVTLETAPSRAPEFWRKIRKTDSEEKRVIQLVWKELQSGANGQILGYNVTVKRGPEVVGSYTVTDTTYNITASKDSYEVVLTAYNSHGSSPPSTLIIPPVKDKVVQPPDMKFKVFSQDGQLWVDWTPSSRALGYVIEWCSNSQSVDCSREWQREPSNTGRAFLRGDIKPFVYYLIRLNALQKDGQERSGTLETYLEQGVPELGPKVDTKACGKTWATLVWDPVPLSKQRGFITNYTIKYEASSGPSKVITVNATDREHTLTSLAGKTTYRVTMTANTEKGGKDGPQSGFTTSEFEKGEIEAIVVPSCIGFLLFILVLCVLFCNKKEQIKKHIWPNVPDPSKSNIAQWSPQTPSRHESKRHPFQDGPFTDVSVVEITADEKKSYSDSDLKSMDPTKKNTSAGLSSGIGGSSCLSSPQHSVSDSDGISSAQNTSSTVQYSTVIMGGYQGQTPMFSRSESTQPLLVSEERPDELQQVSEEEADTPTPSQYFKQSFTQEDVGKIPDPLPAAPAQDLSAQILHLAGFSHGHDSLDSAAGQDLNPDSLSQVDVPSDEQKTYLPQNMRQGGYLPQ
ncbi:hypothetical protein GDO78_014897 [Eleutherodactylus coqui]|uniref:Fibronectin type-III domain-containing protein n=1 Tax=Eleutherodactylus coqui TaxID=57060 RepID=A0A8J6JPN7_ELECQ|nr:hypothetical protein GDO78_014897 [Eleutherodactylus coqui]